MQAPELGLGDNITSVDILFIMLHFPEGVTSFLGRDDVNWHELAWLKPNGPNCGFVILNKIN